MVKGGDGSERRKWKQRNFFFKYNLIESIHTIYRLHRSYKSKLITRLLKLKMTDHDKFSNIKDLK